MILEMVMVMGMMQGQVGQKEGAPPPPPTRVECKAPGPTEPKDGKCQPGQKPNMGPGGKVVFCLSPPEPRGCKPKEQKPK